MRIFKIAFTISALCVLLLTSMKCKKENLTKDDLPPVTQEGKKTFGCIVNGLVLTPYSANSTPALVAQGSNNSYTINVSNFKSNPGKQRLYLSFKKTVTGQITLDCVAYYYGKYNEGEELEICQPFNYKLTINKLDEVNRIFSAIFSVDVPETQNSPALQITDGRFDVKF